ncbi:hypothetical protein STCU_09951 [Strigomonas culicis]|uniref:Uncharacterized protein n=1 Tax=Strigomonas culicis TaxID=28005 RepID=S9TPS2_9TRYP|nr:hypothetical protein STCU_09951 [Strigomonas culicis]|eukprot:EPY18468.1 hypothetical protein STCU_09951 [Strigomonas culicis]
MYVNNAEQRNPHQQPHDHQNHKESATTKRRVTQRVSSGRRREKDPSIDLRKDEYYVAYNEHYGTTKPEKEVVWTAKAPKKRAKKKMDFLAVSKNHTNATTTTDSDEDEESEAAKEENEESEGDERDKDGTFVNHVKSLTRRVSKKISSLLHSKKSTRNRDIAVNSDSHTENDNERDEDNDHVSTENARDTEASIHDADNENATHDSPAKSCCGSLFIDYLDYHSHGNPFEMDPSPPTCDPPATDTRATDAKQNKEAEPVQATTPPKINESQRMASPTSTAGKRERNILSEEVHRQKLGQDKSKAKGCAVVDGMKRVEHKVAQNMKKFKRRLSVSMNVLFASQKEIEHLYNSKKQTDQNSNQVTAEPHEESDSSADEADVARETEAAQADTAPLTPAQAGQVGAPQRERGSTADTTPLPSAPPGTQAGSAGVIDAAAAVPPAPPAAADQVAVPAKDTANTSDEVDPSSNIQATMADTAAVLPAPTEAEKIEHAQTAAVPSEKDSNITSSHHVLE